ncbi:Csat [Trypoxylus dichotomus]
MKSNTGSSTLKYVSLITLTVQNALLGLSMRYARTRDGDMFLSSTAVLMSEIVKLGTCLAIVYIQTGGLQQLFETLRDTIIRQPVDTFKICVPSLVYIIQNNLLYVSASHLDAATYQVTYQMKILTTAMFAVIILKKQLLKTQWFSLLTLVFGVVLVQLAQTTEQISSTNVIHQNRLLGFSAALSACCLSGFAGIYFEKMLKGSDISFAIGALFVIFSIFLYGYVPKSTMVTTTYKVK